MSVTVFGWIATSLSLVYKLPQIYELWKTKKHEGISIISIVIQLVSYGFYITHGIMIDDLPILAMGVAAAVQSIIVVALYYYYK